MDAYEARLRGLLARDVLQEVGAALSAREIRWAVLKGAALHQLGCRAPVDRPVEDVDLLVEEARLSDAIAAAETVGFVAGVRDSVTVTCVRPETPLPLDLHYRLFEPGLFRLDAPGVLRRAQRDGALWFPAPMDLYAHLVGHFAKGRLGVEDRAHLRDFAGVARRFELDTAAVSDHLVRHGLARAARYALSLAAEREHDRFAARVVSSLPADPVGAVLAVAAREAFARETPPAFGSLVSSSLNDTLFRGAASFVRHGARAVERELRARSRRLPLR